MNLSTIKLYLRIDDDDEDAFLSILQIAAEEYLLNAGVNKSYGKATYNLVILMIIAQWYERGCVDYDNLPLGITCLITQLQLQSEERV